MYEQFLSKLQTSVARLHELEYEQHTLTPKQVGEGQQTAMLRMRLRRAYMIPLTRIGRRLLRFAPGIERALKVPHARASHRELVSAGFPKTFLTEFRDLTKELKRIATTSSQRQEKFARVTKELRQELASANETLRILDGLMLARTDRDAYVANTWKHVLRTPKRLGRPPAKKRKRSPNEPAAYDSGEGTLTV
jgi:hypothetical protein